MIDLHCHILPGLDDGPCTVEESVEMCRIAVEDGIETVVATPHFKPGRYETSSAAVFNAIEALKSEIRREKLNLRLLPGAEVTVTPELPDLLKTGAHLTINGGRRYFIAELPQDSIPPRWDAFLLSLMDSGKVPILTHPERNRWFWDHPEALYGFVARGGMVQITAVSLTGQLGDQIREFSGLLLRHNLVHSIASDAHDAGARMPVLAEAVNDAAGFIGRDRALALVTSIPRAIIEGRGISLPAPVPLFAGPRKKTWIEKLISLRN